MNRFWGNIANFTKGERRGAIMFLLIILIFFWVLSIDVFERDAEMWFEVQDSLRIASWIEDINKQQIIRPHNFDPNRITMDELADMGISSSMSVSWVKYIEAGGYFSKKDDLQRLYGMNDSVFSILRPYISIKKRHNKSNQKQKFEYLNNDEPLTFSSFNPAQDSEKQLINAGLQKHVASTIIKYRNSGGTFLQKRDLLKIYVIDSSLYNKIEPYIQLPDKVHEILVSIDSIELNSVTISELSELKLSGRVVNGILKYRDLLGGFHTIDQLHEVYNIDSSDVDRISALCWVDSLSIIKLNINETDQKQLSRHPYFSWEIAGKIIKYRNFVGQIENINELSSLEIFSEVELRKMESYIRF